MIRGSARRRAGYTVTEAMITVAILSVLAAVAAPLLINMTRFWRQTSARSDIQRDVRHALDMIDRFLRQGKASTVNIDQIANQPPYSRIRFTTGGGQNLSFYQQGDELFMVLQSSAGAAATTSLLSKRLAYIAFTYPKTYDTSIVSVAITMAAPTYQGQQKALQLSIQKVRIMN